MSREGTGFEISLNALSVAPIRRSWNGSYMVTGDRWNAIKIARSAKTAQFDHAN